VPSGGALQRTAGGLDGRTCRMARQRTLLPAGRFRQPVIEPGSSARNAHNGASHETYGPMRLMTP
jgi:hypothetical protein